MIAAHLFETVQLMTLKKIADVLTMNPIQETQNRSHRLVLIDELPLYRRGVIELVRRQKDLSVCGEFADRNSALAAIDSLGADLVIMELSTRDGAGVDLIKDLRLRQSRLRILVLSQNPESIHAERVLQAGASGFVSKFEDDPVILKAIRGVLEGQTYFSPQVSAQLAMRYLGVGAMQAASPIQGLTNRELQVFRLIGSGKPTRGIAAALGLSVKTIETYLEHLKRKLGVTERFSGWSAEWWNNGALQCGCHGHGSSLIHAHFFFQNEALSDRGFWVIGLVLFQAVIDRVSDHRGNSKTHSKASDGRDVGESTCRCFRTRARYTETLTDGNLAV